MEKFNRALRGYDVEEVNAFVDQVITKVESMVNELRKKDANIAELQSLKENNDILNDKVTHYSKMERTLNEAIFMAQKTSEQMKLAASKECEILIDDAKKNANRIVNEALLHAEKTEMEANMLRRNVNIFKRRLKEIIESQLEMVNDIEKVDF